MSDIWHGPTETPDVFKSHPIIVVYEAGDQIEQMDSKEYSNLVGERYVNRWCYVDELIKELIRTRKALDVAVQGIKKLGEYDPYKDPQSIYTIAQDIIEQITALEQKENKI